MRQIPGFSRYAISESGEVVSYFNQRGRRKVPISLKPSKDTRGYLYVSIKPDGGGKTYPMRIHRAVALTYLGAPTGPVVRHLDDNKLNNHISNLAYGTYQDNVDDAKRNGHVYGKSMGRIRGCGWESKVDTMTLMWFRASWLLGVHVVKMQKIFGFSKHSCVSIIASRIGLPGRTRGVKKRQVAKDWENLV